MQAQAATGRAAHLRIHVVELAEFDQARIKYACAQASVGSVMARKEQGGVASTLRELAYASRKTTPHLRRSATLQSSERNFWVVGYFELVGVKPILPTCSPR